MANELIAEAITDYFGERCLDYAEGCPTCEAWAEYDRMNTRPAAPVEGLETVGYAEQFSDGKIEVVSVNEGKHCKVPLVTRSQAEAIIAALKKDRLPDGHTVLEQADTLDGRVSQTVRVEATGEEYERIVHADEAYGEEE